MRVCFDTNVVIDILAKSEWFLNSFASYDVCALRRFDVCLPSSAITDIAYILHRQGLSHKKVRDEILPTLFEMFEIVDVSGADCRAAAGSTMKDFEDAVVACSASRNGADLIITRNIKDFKHSPVTAIDPKTFVKQFKPSDIEYDEVELP